jgi:hypothetical protein
MWYKITRIAYFCYLFHIDVFVTFSSKLRYILFHYIHASFYPHCTSMRMWDCLVETLAWTMSTLVLLFLIILCIQLLSSKIQSCLLQFVIKNFLAYMHVKLKTKHLFLSKHYIDGSACTLKRNIFISVNGLYIWCHVSHMHVYFGSLS